MILLYDVQASAPVLFGLVCVGGTGFAAENTKKQKEKGPALQQLEDAAGKKIEDVKVPDVPKPTPAKPDKKN